MGPCERQEEDEDGSYYGGTYCSSTSDDDTVVHHTPDGAPFVICKSSKPFVNPTIDNNNSNNDQQDPERVNQQLNLNLGFRSRLLTRENKVLLWLLRGADFVLVRWWEAVFFYVWTEMVPLQLKRKLIQYGWAFWLNFHQWALGKTTGLHPSQSFEYHALTTLMYPSSFLAWTPSRIRFALSELYASAPNEPPSPQRIRVINYQQQNSMEKVPVEQTNHCTVQGWYIYNQTKYTPSEKGVIFWIYGGAYLGGDVRGNSSAADYIAQKTGMDVFIPQYRLAPEANLFDVLWDICLAYQWLLQDKHSDDEDKQQQQQQQQRSNSRRTIFVLGISSGAAVAARLMQLIAQKQQGQDLLVPPYFGPLVQELIMPNAGILFSPYVDYEQLHEYERKGTFLHYARHDLVVNRAVQEYGLPYLGPFIPVLEEGEPNRTSRRKQSPIHIPFQGLPPLCVVASEHEAVYDMTMNLVNQARSEGVSVTLGLWKYMCHVFSMMHGFLPEGQISMDFVVDWIKQQQQQQQHQIKTTKSSS